MNHIPELVKVVSTPPHREAEFSEPQARRVCCNRGAPPPLQNRLVSGRRRLGVFVPTTAAPPMQPQQRSIGWRASRRYRRGHLSRALSLAPRGNVWREKCAPRNEPAGAVAVSRGSRTPRHVCSRVATTNTARHGVERWHCPARTVI